MLKSAELQRVLGERAAEIAARAGTGYESDTKLMGTRVIASVYTADAETAQAIAATVNAKRKIAELRVDMSVLLIIDYTKEYSTARPIRKPPQMGSIRMSRRKAAI